MRPPRSLADDDTARGHILCNVAPPPFHGARPARLNRLALSSCHVHAPQLAMPSSIEESLLSPVAAAERLARLAFELREAQLGGADDARFGGVLLPGSALCCDGDPSFLLTCGAVWAWGAAQRAGGCRPEHLAGAEAQLCEVARAAAWQHLVRHVAAQRASASAARLAAPQAAALLLAAASERLLADSNEEVAAQTALAEEAAADLAAALEAPYAADGGPPASWLLLPLLLYAHAAARPELAAAGRRLVLRATSFPELPFCWWDDLPPAGLCPWAGAVVAAIVACQGEQELVPWCARAAAARLPSAFRGTTAAGEGVWAHNASLVMALQALQRALPRGWAPLRRAERAAATAASAALRQADMLPAGGPATVARLLLACALYGFSVEPGGSRVCC